MALRDNLKRVRAALTWWAHPQTLAHLEQIRKHELESVMGLLPEKGRLLEIGAGTGWQAAELQSRGYEVSAIDVATSIHAANRILPITEYDGRRIPFADATFDIVFSSNVLEHIPYLHEFQHEIHRVLKPDGRAVHVVPSGSWRFWTILTHGLRVWTVPNVHGEHAGNAISEIFWFSRRRWSRMFRDTGWQIESVSSNHLFYTGLSVMDRRWSMSVRQKLSRVLGGSCHIFELRHASP